ncbi:DUF4124 domain-containing protein [Oxalobacteraceae sp. CFBP 8761]|nr:DUF4124 domain-containing protein [Oxalobacteraceae sp. CFBP 8761]
MKRHFCQLCLLAATMMAAPVAFSETSIVKCVDDEGRVTLTDRPCEVGATTVQMASEPANEGVTRVHAYPLVAEASTLPPPRAMQRSHVPTPRAAEKPLASDVATLKAARAQFVLSDVRSTPALAGLD